MYDSASDSPANIATAKLQTSCDSINMDVPTVCQRVAYEEALPSDSDIQHIVDTLEDVLLEI